MVAGARGTDSLEGIEGVTAVPVDLAAPKGPGQLIAHALEAHGRLDVLVNNVGAVRIRSEGFLGTSDEEFEWAMQLNFFSALRATRAAITHMAEAGGGSIVNVCSVNAFFQPDAGTIDYGAAKAALLPNLSKSLAQEFGAKGIHVNCVSPGPVTTELWLGDHGVAATVAGGHGRGRGHRARGGRGEHRRLRHRALHRRPRRSRRWSCCWPRSARANVTGANYVIDGGLIKTT